MSPCDISGISITSGLEQEFVVSLNFKSSFRLLSSHQFLRLVLHGRSNYANFSMKR